MTKGKGKLPGFGGLGKHLKSAAHKERSQPAARKHLGPLEKQQDYKKRATRRHDKTKKLAELKRAAANRNPDEFDPKMIRQSINATGKKRKNVTQESRKKQQEAELVLNARNVNYLKWKVRNDRKAVKELSGEATDLGAVQPVRSTHTIFVDSEDAQESFSPTEYFNTTEEFLDKPAIRPNLAVASRHPREKSDPSAAHKLATASAMKHRELHQRERRMKRVGRLVRKVEKSMGKMRNRLTGKDRLMRRTKGKQVRQR